MSRSPLRLTKTIGRNYSVDLKDVLRTKQALVDLGEMHIPDYGLTPYPDDLLFEAIRSYQRHNKLSEDGVIEPDGPTQRSLNRSLQQKSAPTEQEARKNLAFSSNEASGPTAGPPEAATEPEIVSRLLRENKTGLADLLQQFPTLVDDDALQSVLSHRATNLAALSDREKDICDKRLENELRECSKLPGHAHGPCAQRAFIRWGLCYRYGYPPGSDREPPKWGPGDMERWFNPRR